MKFFTFIKLLLLSTLLITSATKRMTAMPLKYQSEIDAFNFSFECPNNVSAIDKEVEVFRFSFDPIQHSNNFLPNVVFDRINGGGFNYAGTGNETKKCERCGTSFYYDDTLARRAWKSIPPRRKENLKYTHLAKGIFIPGDGLVTEANDYSHFGFYEAENVDEDYLKKKFENVTPPL